MALIIDDTVPGTTPPGGLRYVAEIAGSAPLGGKFLDAGAFYGAVSRIMALNAPEPEAIYAVDTWEPAGWISRMREKRGITMPFSQESFRQMMKDVPFVTPVQGRAEEVLKRWENALDMIFLDTRADNPHFGQVLEAAVRALAPDGVLCGDNYTIRHPDTVHDVDELAARWGRPAEVRGRVWALRKPLRPGAAPKGVAPLAAGGDKPGVSVTADCDFMSVTAMPPECWAGQQGKAGVLRAFRLDWINKPEGVDVIYRCAAAGSASSAAVRGGEWCYAGESRKPIISVYMALAGERAGDYRLTFQAGFSRDGRAAFREKMNSRYTPGGKWLKSPSRGAPISALRVIIEPAVRQADSGPAGKERGG